MTNKMLSLISAPGNKLPGAIFITEGEMVFVGLYPMAVTLPEAFDINKPATWYLLNDLFLPFDPEVIHYSEFCGYKELVFPPEKDLTEQQFLDLLLTGLIISARFNYEPEWEQLLQAALYWGQNEVEDIRGLAGFVWEYLMKLWRLLK